MKGMSILIQNSLNISTKFLKRVLLYFPYQHGCILITHFIMLFSDNTPKSDGIWKVGIEIYLFCEVCMREIGARITGE